VHDRSWPADVIAVCPGLDIYLDGKVAEAREDDVISRPPRRGDMRGCGTSASRSVACALRFTRQGSMLEIDGRVLPAPFFGTPGAIAGIASAGGRPAWAAISTRASSSERGGSRTTSFERPLGQRSISVLAGMIVSCATIAS